MKITGETTLADILKLRGADKILAKFNIPCLGCPFAKFEIEKLKIGDVCRNYDLALENLLKELNKLKK